MRVLVCVDDDPLVDEVVSAVDALVATTKWDEIFVLHVMPSSPLFLVGSGLGGSGLVSPGGKRRARIDAFVASVVERLSHLPATVESLVTTGDPAQSIVRTADANEVDLIVIGARGTSREFPVGSVSQKVVSLADSDVLVVRACDLTGSDFRALVTVDGSEGSEAGINAFATKLRAERASIHLVHVIEAPPSLWAVDSGEHAVSAPLVLQAERLLARAASLLAARGLEAECEWHHGSPAEEILRIANRRGCALIVVGSRGHARLAQLLLGPMTLRILRHAPCHVLCARAWSPEWATLSSGWTSESAEPEFGMA